MKRISFPLISGLGYFGIGIVQGVMVYDHFDILASLCFFVLGITRLLCLCHSLTNAKICDRRDV